MPSDTEIADCLYELRGEIRQSPDGTVYELNLLGTGVTDRWLVEIGKLKSLKKLNLGMSYVKGNGLVHLRKLRALETLGLNGLPIDDEALEHLRDITTLRFLFLGGSTSKITNAGLEHLSGLVNLETLILSHSPVTDAGMRHLERMTKLKKLDLPEHISKKCVKHLQRCMPQATITAGPFNLFPKGMDVNVTAIRADEIHLDILPVSLARRILSSVARLFGAGRN